MLTDAKCRNAVCPPDKKQARFADSGGMYLQVSPAGSKRWFLKYRLAGVEKQMALGGYPNVTLTAARKARDAAKLQKAEGIDPLQARQVEKLKATVGSGDTLEAAANDWLERGKPNWSDTHYVREKRNITKDLVPYLGKRAIASIKPIELLALPSPFRPAPRWLPARLAERACSRAWRLNRPVLSGGSMQMPRLATAAVAATMPAARATARATRWFAQLHGVHQVVKALSEQLVNLGHHA